MVMMCEDFELAKIIEDGLDFHSFVASKVYGIRMDQVTKEIRTPIKQTTFGLLYGQGVATMAADLHLELKKAQKIVDAYWKAMPKVKGWIEQQHLFAKKHGYVINQLGQRRFLPGINSGRHEEEAQALREAVNSPVQGCASELCLASLGRSWKRVKECGIEAYPYAFVHDSLTFDVCPGRFFDIMELVYYEMVVVPKKMFDWVIVRTDASFDVGVNWGWSVEANLLFDKNLNFDHNCLDLRGKPAHIDSLLEEIERGGQKVNELQRCPHPKPEEAALGYWQSVVYIDRPDPKVLYENGELIIV
jgi:DNA polymerase-1